MTTLARQNDAFRQAHMPISFDGEMLRGRFVMTIRVARLDHEIVLGVLKKLREFEDFNSDNDPYGEHDFVAFSYPVDGRDQRFIFKIDYYSDASMNFASSDPVNPSATYRTGVLMLACEY
ncbi:DUF3768 domain-containing protein [Brevundimonas naejangsanensis]|nr:DUF3768 domain-containing protein [Brevundimonas naejangsanensis]